MWRWCGVVCVCVLKTVKAFSSIKTTFRILLLLSSPCYASVHSSRHQHPSRNQIKAPTASCKETGRTQTNAKKKNSIPAAWAALYRGKFCSLFMLHPLFLADNEVSGYTRPIQCRLWGKLGKSSFALTSVFLTCL